MRTSLILSNLPFTLSIFYLMPKTQPVSVHSYATAQINLRDSEQFSGREEVYVNPKRTKYALEGMLKMLCHK